MLNISLTIMNPWNDRWDMGKCFSGRITKNKSWELQFPKTNTILCVEFKLTTKQDHAGLYTEFNVFGRGVIFQIYDNRHWDYETQKWSEREKDLL